MKKIYLPILVLLFFVLCENSILAETDDSPSSYELYDDTFDHILDNISPETLARQTVTDCLEPQQIVDDLLMIGAPDAIENGRLYCATYPPNIRSVHRLPATQIYFDRNENWSMGVNLFYNQMLKTYFTAHSPFIKSYLNIQNPDFLEKLDLEFAPGAADIVEVFPLFTQIKLQERRVGVMLGTNKQWAHGQFTIVLPLYYLVQNFFLTDSEIDDIKSAPLFAGAGAGNEENDVTAFFLKHLVSTKIGFGDLKFRLDECISRGACHELNMGFQLIVPSAVDFNSCKTRLWWGDELLFGGVFCKNSPVPPFDLTFLFNTYFCCDPDLLDKCKAEITAYLLAFGTGALDRLTANVGDLPLGQEHVSFGPIATYTLELKDGISWENYFAIEYFFPRKRTRFFLANVNPLEFARDYTDPAQAVGNIAFLQQQIVNLLFPIPACVTVHPGINAQWTSYFAYDQCNFHGEFGYDFWFQGKEYIGASAQQREQLLIHPGVKPWAYQSKLFLKLIGNCNNWHIGFQTDITIRSRGIGKDQTFAVMYSYDF